MEQDEMIAEWGKIMANINPPAIPWWQRMMTTFRLGFLIPRPHYNALRRRLIHEGRWNHDLDV